MKRFYNCIKIALLIFILICFQDKGYSQANDSSDTKILDSLLSKQDFKNAKSFLTKNISLLETKKSYLELTKRIYYYGKIALNENDTDVAIQGTLAFANSITDLTDSLSVARQKHMALSRFYVLLRDYNSSLIQNLKALELTKKMPYATGDLFGLIHHNLSIDYRRMGNIKDATLHSHKSLKYYLSYPKSEKTKILDAYNSLGGRMWDAYKIDSALYYFKKGEDLISKLEPNPVNKFYYSASNQANIASVNSSLGNISESLKYNEKSIKNYLAFIRSNATAKDFFKEEARMFLYIAIENYASDFSKQGDYEKAKDLNTFALQEKKKFLDANDPEIAYTYLQVANSHLKLKNYETAEELIDKSLKIYLNKEQKDYLSIADAYYYKGVVNEYYENIELAKDYYEKSKGLYEDVFGDNYDTFYLQALLTISEFYSKHGFTDKAIDISTKTYNYVVNNQGKSTVLEYSQLLNLAKIQYQSKNYVEASKMVNKSLALLDSSYSSEVNELNFINKPAALALQINTELKLNDTKDTQFLKTQFKKLKAAISILEQQKIKANIEENVSIIIDDNNNVFELSKEIAMMLYNATNDDEYLKEVLSIHESKVYNKIRQQLNLKSGFTFDGIPQSIIDKEKKLKDNLNIALETEGSLENYLKINENWNTFLETLKHDYPKYYNLRYASISKSLDFSGSKFYNDKSIIRYLYIKENLYAFIIENNTIKTYNINANALKNALTAKAKENTLLEQNLNSNHNIYNILWKPFADTITNSKVIIIPDGDLFNISFETLTATSVNSFKVLVKESLLKKYSISYNYSLLLIDKNKTPKFFENNFVAFSPEFNDKMKNNYIVAISDSVLLDKTYLNLIPQPFTVNLAKEFSTLFNGNSFVNEKASKQVFIKEAKEHKIIHIGTHAESDNISPDLSRLIFAKNLNDTNKTDDNSLYTYEIYNQNLASNLAILTACETGKPTFQPGEGMISLAHAFNYAGSESILTSLWKIDEKSSAKIIEHFYGHLKNGLPKDEALQKAKLDYLSTAEGRTRSPQYWAGLVLIGDTSPIALSKSTPLRIWVLAGFILMVLIYFIFRTSSLNKNFK